jgi:alpha-glucosidase
MRLTHALLVSAVIMASATGSAMAAEHVLDSPDKSLTITFSDTDGRARYAVARKGKPLLTPSPLGLALDKGGALSTRLAITGAVRTSVDQTYDLVVGKTRTVRDHYNELTVDLAEAGPAGRKLRVIARAYDDGVAFRYVLPDQPNLAGVAIRGEETRFDFAADDRCWALNLGRFGTSHEGEYDLIQASKFRASALFELPVVCQTADGTTFALAEADLKDFAGLYLSGRGDGGLGLQASSRPGSTIRRSR